MLQSINSEKGNLEHVYQFQETPQGDVLTAERYNDIVVKAGQEASRLSEALAGMQGQLSARAARARRT